ncbi:MAG: TOBE domain-containing protein [Anaerolineae bacterium]
MVYIGTDSRYIVDLHDGGTVVSRVQNSGRDALTVFAPGDRVHVIWQPEHAQTLTQ